MIDRTLADMPKLKQDDTIILLSEQKSNKVKVIGAVNKPDSSISLKRLNLFELIYIGGRAPRSAGDLSR